MDEMLMTLPACWRRKLREPRHAKQVDFKLVTGVGQGRIFHRAVHAKASVVDQHVDAAMALGDGVHGRDDVSVHRNVHLQRYRAQAPQVFHLGQATGRDVNHQALLQQPFGRFFAHAGRCAGDERHLFCGGCGCHEKLRSWMCCEWRHGRRWGANRHHRIAPMRMPKMPSRSAAFKEQIVRSGHNC
jgi:hypothetical protein